jgi:hypothetical protein
MLLGAWHIINEAGPTRLLSYSHSIKILRINGGAPFKFGGLFIFHIMLTDIEVKVAYVISGLVFQIGFRCSHQLLGFTSSSNGHSHN